MKSHCYKDCYFDRRGNVLKLGNSRIERRYQLINGELFSTAIADPRSGHVWASDSPLKTTDIGNLLLQTSKFDPACEVRIDCLESDENGLTLPHLRVDLHQQYPELLVINRFVIFPRLPFISFSLLVGRSGGGSDASQGHAPGRSLRQTTDGDTGINRDGPGQDRNALYGNIEDEVKFNAAADRGTGPADTVDTIPVHLNHGTLHTFTLRDVTDRHDFPVLESEETLYHQQRECDGSLFLLDDLQSGAALMLIREAPTAAGTLNKRRPDLIMQSGKFISLGGTGITADDIDGEDFLRSYGWTVGMGKKADLLTDFKRLYSAGYGLNEKRPFCLANTWGDRSQDAAVCESFIMREIDSAAELGIDFLQIDDGWQQGITANSALQSDGVWEGYYAVDENFWNVNADKFPRGLKPLTDHARVRGVGIGLWFSPDSSHDFRNWQRDVDTLMRYHRDFGIGQFKLDGIKIRSKRGERNLLHFLERLSIESRGAIAFNMDVTAEVRLGYLYAREYGNLFVENRYTDWTNYYPYRTAKNLWLLSKVLPAQRLHFELLNNRRNMAKYGDDLFAPALYTMDYLLASVMVSCPLFWMELQNLPEEGKQELRHIIPFYKRIREELFRTLVMPVGERPDGRTWFGFHCRGEEDCDYLLAFRDSGEADAYTFMFPPAGEARSPRANGEIRAEIIHAAIGYGDVPDAAPCVESVGPGGIRVTLPLKRSYCIIRLTG